MCLTAEARAGKAGRLDGESGIPVWDDQTHSPYVWLLQARAQRTISDLEEKFDRIDTPLKVAFGSIREARDEWQRSRDAARGELDAALDQHEQEHGVRPAVVRPASYLSYIIVMSVVVLGELPLNYVVFNILGLLVPLQLLIAAIIGLAFVWCAHILGHLLHERPMTRVRIVQSALLAVGPPVVMSGLAYMREVYTAGIQASFRQVAESLAGVPVFEVSPAKVFWTFLGLNMMFYLLGVVFSYWWHNPLAMAAHGLAHAQKRLARATRALRTARDRRVKNAYRFNGLGGGVRSNCHQLVASYNVANLRARDVAAERQASSDPSRGQPVSFLALPYVEVPEHWFDPHNKLDWS